MPKFKPENAEYWAKRKANDPRKDWRTSGGTWLDDYVGSKMHPHRQLVGEVIGWINGHMGSILEVGCSTGPNIAYMRERFTELKDTSLAGVDISAASIKRAKKEMPGVKWKVGEATNLPFPDHSFDLVLADACLMYLGPKEITKAISELNRVARKAIVVVDWYDARSTKGVIKDFHWARNYAKLLTAKKFKIKTLRFMPQHWPSENWQRNGRIFYGVKNTNK